MTSDSNPNVLHEVMENVHEPGKTLECDEGLRFWKPEHTDSQERFWRVCDGDRQVTLNLTLYADTEQLENRIRQLFDLD